MCLHAETINMPTHTFTNTHTHSHSHTNWTKKEEAVHNNGAVFCSENWEFIIRDNGLVGKVKRSRTEGLNAMY